MLQAWTPRCANHLNKEQYCDCVLTLTAVWQSQHVINVKQIAKVSKHAANTDKQ